MGCNWAFKSPSYFLPFPYPAKAKWDGWGFEYKSEARIGGLPLLHVAFKFRPNRVPVPAVIAIAQLGLYIHEGRGQAVKNLMEWIETL